MLRAALRSHHLPVSSFPRKRESSIVFKQCIFELHWIPAYACMTRYSITNYHLIEVRNGGNALIAAYR
jgi:hypothetical protein